MNNDGLKEKLTLYRNIFTVFWTSFFVLGSGLYTISFHAKNMFYLILLFTGLIFEIILFSFAVFLIFKCKKMINKLMEIQ